jgi:hypothetical protein
LKFRGPTRAGFDRLESPVRWAKARSEPAIGPPTASGPKGASSPARWQAPAGPGGVVPTRTRQRWAYGALPTLCAASISSESTLIGISRSAKHVAARHFRATTGVPCPGRDWPPRYARGHDDAPARRLAHDPAPRCRPWHHRSTSASTPSERDGITARQWSVVS